MKNRSRFPLITVTATLGLLVMALGMSAQAQRTGDVGQVNIGIVEGKQRVQLQSNAGRNALIGGALAWGIARNQSSATQAAAALGGAALGGGGTSAVEGDNMAVQYTVRTGEGSLIQVVTDQTQIVVGDCVLVEQRGDTANIRRKDPAMCRPQTEEVMAQVQPELDQDADQCHAATQRLFAAETVEEVEVARQVMEILCND